MKACFADTFYFLAMLTPRHHSPVRAVQLSRSLTCPLVTTTRVPSELADAMCLSPRRERFGVFLQQLRREPRTIIIPTSDERFEPGLDLSLSRSDEDSSLTDCISFVVMQREGLTDALTGDRHYEQAGFVALLK